VITEQPQRTLSDARLVAGGYELFMRFATSPEHEGLLPVVLVHGLSVSSRYMVPVARRLAPYRDVYAPDLPGFGLSEKPPRALTIPELAEVLLSWMDVVGIERAVMLGNSMGCQIIAEAAARRPERVAAAVLVGPTMDRRARTVAGHAWRLLRALRHEPLASIVTQGSDYLRAGPIRTLATLRHALRDPIERKLLLLRGPALFVRGGSDPIAPQAWVEELAALVPDSELLVIADGPHALNYDRPGALAVAVLAFLGRRPQLEVSLPRQAES
jgi:2-hydroxy-6-oxonona-2,4-dienedioate hydrolase